MARRREGRLPLRTNLAKTEPARQRWRDQLTLTLPEPTRPRIRPGATGAL
jgi:hypothetical protein